MNLLVLTYFDIEAYPPTLNAINCTSFKFRNVIVLYRNQITQTWPFSKNVEINKSGPKISARIQENSNLFYKIYLFLIFTKDLLRLFRNKKFEIVIVYDSIALLAYGIIKSIYRNKNVKLWYHNHDLTEIKNLRRFSIGWLAYIYESKKFKKIDYFSVPSNERLSFFKINELKNNPFIIPNYPSLEMYSKFIKENIIGKNIKLIYQGRISEERGLLLIVPILKNKVNGKGIELHIKGFVDNDFKEKLNKLASDYDSTDRIFWYEAGPYNEVPILASNCNIGLALLNNLNANKRSLGTASNKIYEYTALGLPVIYSNFDFNLEYYKDLNWAIPVNYSTIEILDAIHNIEANYSYFSKEAIKSFVNKLNFEYHFNIVIEKILVNL